MTQMGTKSFKVLVIVLIVMTIFLSGCGTFPRGGKQMYKLIYDGGEGLYDAVEAISIVSGQHVILTQNMFIKFGHKFTGWSDGKHTYIPGEKYKMLSEDVTMTALWDKDGTVQQIFSGDSADGWWGETSINLGTDKPREGSGYVESRGSSLVIFCTNFNSPIDLSDFHNGTLHMWVYVSDVKNLKKESGASGMIELYDQDGKIYGWPINQAKLNDGWNEIFIPLGDATVKNADLTKITSFRFFQYVNARTTIRLDDFSAWTPEDRYSIEFSCNNYDRHYSVNDKIMYPGFTKDTVMVIPKNIYVRNGYDFSGWTDGENIYDEFSKYTVPEKNVVFTPHWTKSPEYIATFVGGDNTTGGAPDNIKEYPGNRISLPLNSFIKEGYSFTGWSDGEELYKAGSLYPMSDSNIEFTAEWKEISDYNLLADAVEAWQLDDGGPSGVATSAIKNGTPGTHKWGTWLNYETFGQALDFSTDGSYMLVEDTSINLGDNFTISTWIMAPKREQKDRVIISSDWKLYLDMSKDGELNFEAEGLEGLDSSGKKLVDGKWHHVMVAYDGSLFKYWIDGECVKELPVRGSVTKGTGDTYIGANREGKEGFKGSIAQVRIYESAKSPSEVTKTTLNSSDNDKHKPTLGLKKGVTMERNGFTGMQYLVTYEVYDPNFEYRTIEPQDLKNVKELGFDNAKITITPNNLIDEKGSLIEENMIFLSKDVDAILEQGLDCLLCIHPEPDFKPTYLGNLESFEILIKWYGEFATYVGERWTPEEVAIQLMTEPYGNTNEVKWYWMSDRMWSAVRNVLPDFTIITSSDSSGNIEYLKMMVPVSDPNLFYSFTTYEPYSIGFGTATGGMGGQVLFWNYLGEIPYPVSENLTEKEIDDMVENITSKVPAHMLGEARTVVGNYLRGIADNGPHYINHYDMPYNADWHMTRMSSLNDWSEKYGGNIHLLCAEFGCMDSTTAKKHYGAMPGTGISDQTRIRFLTDMIAAFHEYDISWNYWTYNGVFTIYKPSLRVWKSGIDDETFRKWYDADLIENAMRLKPQF